MENLSGLLGIRRMDLVLNALIRELYEVMKWVDDKDASRVYVGECTKCKASKERKAEVCEGQCVGHIHRDEP